MLQYTMSRYDSQLPWSSYITKDSNGLVTKMLLTNNSVGELLERAYHYFDYPGIVLWPAGVPAPPNPADITPEWKKANCYTYQLICEPMPYDSARRLLQQELQRLFGYTATVGYSRATRYVLKTREGFNNGPPLTAMDAAQSADVLQITRYLSRKYRIELDCKLPLSLCTNINMQALTGKDLAGCEALLNQQEFYFTREQVEKRALFIHHPSN